MSSPQYISVSDCCRLLGICPRTVTKWFDSGLLKGYRLPGPRGHRRILRQSVLDLAQQQGIPLRSFQDGGSC